MKKPQKVTCDLCRCVLNTFEVNPKWVREVDLYTCKQKGCGKRYAVRKKVRHGLQLGRGGQKSYSRFAVIVLPHQRADWGVEA
jgi:hypothetical protein